MEKAAQRARYIAETARPGDAARGPALIAVALLAMLLLQPALCMLHCAAMARAVAHAHAPTHHDGMLCSLAEGHAEQAAHVSVPPFWPSLPAAAPIWVGAVAALLALSAPPPRGLRSISWSPPLHPPRPTAAAA